MMPHQQDYSFGKEPSIIKVIGVGGGGGNAVSYMYTQGIRGVDFFICNTDIQALDLSPVPNKVQIGKNLTQGLGAGANPERGRSAAFESKDEIRNILGKNTKMLFITAGMGGGTGTGAAPVIAEIAKELGVLTVGIVTAPFSFEGKPKRQRAQEGIDTLREHCDTVLVILNDRLREVFGKASMREAFRQADNVLLKAAKSIAEIITVSGNINVDFEDVRTVMQNAGAAVMGSATAEGENRARRAAEGAISSPLLNNTNIFGAKYILLSIVVGNDEEFQMDELEEITEYIQEQAGEEAEIIFGQAVDEELGDSISVTIIATGFEAKQDIPLETPERRVYDLMTNKRVKNRIDVKDEEDEEDFFDSRNKARAEVAKEPETAAPTTPKIEPVAPIVPTKPDKIIFQLEDDYNNEPNYESERLKKKDGLTSNLASNGASAPLNGVAGQNLYGQGYKPTPVPPPYPYASQSIKSVNEYSPEELQERKETPAYIRKNIQLKDIARDEKGQE
ncbi:cell division protein FtsZ [Hugenholtzia roseola]|uniref:cell division protein FtsZ n=1 Tax=Hugenholtzia roseola TaxID=1002 RepID=UPI000A324C4A|nr:cell division protein FtsZ [Hugenholtzia roseola]